MKLMDLINAMAEEKVANINVYMTEFGAETERGYVFNEKGGFTEYLGNIEFENHSCIEMIDLLMNLKNSIGIETIVIDKEDEENPGTFHWIVESK